MVTILGNFLIMLFKMVQVSLAITRLVGSIDLNRVMGDARYRSAVTGQAARCL